MKKLMVKGNEHTLLDSNDVCPICDASRKDMLFSWNMFHGEATSSCCGAVFQIKDYYIEKPDDDQKELLELLRGDFIDCVIKKEWIQPLKQAMQNTGNSNINNDEVFEEAERIMGREPPKGE